MGFIDDLKEVGKNLLDIPELLYTMIKFPVDIINILVEILKISPEMFNTFIKIFIISLQNLKIMIYILPSIYIINLVSEEIINFEKISKDKIKKKKEIKI